ncbi:GUN4 domain-containing protein [Synechococcus sp. RSCCF101]|uniref:GUN4 domain-containing protein n=1 Tax=Synechococcus sp. RSCCF101 TaxID=2511069 RepID=UPI0012456168|nr:GUN4 domain-containing protein [Synechococcus sp. RSCCF101]QEY31589.1 GUN4 domain-containing protein [Synechococcus sp. RSCCF101]
MLSGPSTSRSLRSDDQLEAFLTGSARQRRTLATTIESQAGAIAGRLGELLSGFNPEGDDWAAGWLLQLAQRENPDGSDAPLARWPEGWLRADSAAGIDHAPLQLALLRCDFEQADRITSETLRALAGDGAIRRGYVYYSEVAPMPALDLQTLDRLWLTYSQGRFGFSVQGRLLKAAGGRWDRLWPRIGWKADGVWTRYPGSFTWTLEAPEGHMPLVNQLRGVRLMDALLNHPALAARVA